MLTTSEIDAYLADCRELTVRELRTIIPTGGRYGSVLYDLMLEYPLREAKALRPALCIATCRALGGSLEAVLRSAAILELYHNAFLIHDDVEDGSEHRRDRPTLHTMHGTPIAVNVGDAMLALALEPLLDNMRSIGMGKALRILQVIARMARESTEGQAIELHWIRQGEWRLADADYVRMVYKKTSWYTFIAPVLIGALVAGAPAPHVVALRKLAAVLGIAFQIQDDVLNLVAEGGRYGKEAAGDLWEGKRTLILLHAMRQAPARERALAETILRKPRTAAAPLIAPRAGDGLPAAMAADDSLAPRGADDPKTAADVAFLRALVDHTGSIEYARGVGGRFAGIATAVLDGAAWLAPSVHRSFIAGLVGFVTDRDR